MKKLHLLNIGLPKTGTTWLFKQIEKQSWFDQTNIVKENNLIEKDQNFEQYISKYCNYDYTANFNTRFHTLGSSYIKLLRNIESSRVSIILRNPFEQLVSYYYHCINCFPSYKQKGYEDPDKSLFEWTQDYLQIKALTDYSKIIDRWMNFFPNLKIFVYDDLLNDPDTFLQKYSEDMNLPLCKNIDPTPILVGNYNIDLEGRQAFRSKFNDKITKICVDLANKNYIKDKTMKKWLDRDRHF